MFLKNFNKEFFTGIFLKNSKKEDMERVENEITQTGIGR